MAFYNDTDELIDIAIKEEISLANGLTTDYMEAIIPKGATKAKAFLWNSIDEIDSYVANVEMVFKI